MGLLAKDLSIALQVGRQTATPRPFSALYKQLVLAAQEMFGDGADHTEKPRLCEKPAGTEPGTK